MIFNQNIKVEISFQLKIYFIRIRIQTNKIMIHFIKINYCLVSHQIHQDANLDKIIQKGMTKFTNKNIFLQQICGFKIINNK